MSVRVRYTRNPFDWSKAEGMDMPAGSLQSLYEGLPEEMREGGKGTVRAFVNGLEVPQEDWSEEQVLDTFYASFLVAPTGLEVATVLQIVTALIAVASAIDAQSRLRAITDGAQERNDESSANFGFSGYSNTRRQGLPLEVPCGLIRMAPTVIGEYVDNQEEGSVLYQLLSFGWGPIKSIGGIDVATPQGQRLNAIEMGTLLEINGNPGENYAGVELEVRLGNNTQDAILGFQQIRVPAEVGPFDLLSPETGEVDSFGIAPGYDITSPFDTTNDAYRATYGREFDVVEPADQIIIRLRFPGGFYSFTNGNQLANAGFRYQIYYQELDGALQPTGPLVRINPSGVQSFARQSLFDYDIRFTLFDPLTYEPPLPGTALQIPNGGGSLEMPDLNRPVPVGAELPLVSLSTWIKPDPGLGSNPNVGDVIFIAGNYEAGGNEGFGIYFKRIFLGSVFNQAWQLTAIKGNGSILFELHEQATILGGSFEDIPTDWMMVTLVYERDQRIELYLNDQVVLSRSAISDLSWPNGPFRVGESPGFSTPGLRFQGLVDQVQVYEERLTAPQVASIYNGGQGIIPERASTRSLWNFETVGSVPQNTAWPTPWWDAATGLSGGTTSGQAPGVIPGDGVQKPKRMRARVGIVRISEDSTNQNTVDDFQWVETQRITDELLEYPQTPLLGTLIPASDQLNTSIPTSTAVIEGGFWPVWDGASTTAPNLNATYTSNPAWFCLGILLNKQWGLGRDYSASSVKDWNLLLEWANYCDEIVYDGGVVVSYQTGLPGVGFDDVRFINSTQDANGDVRGSIEFQFQNSTNGIRGVLPDWAVVGRYVRALGFPTQADDPDLANDINFGESDAGGYEIFEITQTSTQSAWIVKAYWDRTSEPDPWATGTGINLQIGGGGNLGTARVEGGEKRHEYNGVFDTAREAWAQLQRVAGIARGRWIRVGGGVTLTFSRPRQAVALVTSGSIRPETFDLAYADSSVAPNFYDLTILDRDRRYERNLIEVPPPVTTLVQAGGSVRREAQTLAGVTSRSQAFRHGRFEILVGQNVIRSGTFESGPLAIHLQVGDVFRIGHDLMPRGEGGRVASASVGAPQGLLLDADNLGTGNWGLSGVTIAASGTDPYGQPAFLISDASAVDLGRISQQANGVHVDPDGLVQEMPAGIYGMSCLVQAGTSTYARGTLVLPGGVNRFATFDLAAGNVRIDGGTEDGGASIYPVGGTGWYLIRVWGAFLPRALSDTVTWSLAPAAGPTGEDATEVGDLLVSQPSLTCGRFGCLPLSPDRGIVLGRALTIAGGEQVHIRDSQMRVGTASVDPALSPAGDYPAGSVLSLESAAVDAEGLAVVAGSESEFIVSTPDTELLGEVSSVEVREDLSIRIGWSEYSEAIYQDRAEAQNGGLALTASDSSGDERDFDTQRLPELVILDPVTDSVVMSPSGIPDHRVRVTWTLNDRDAGKVSEVHVWARLAHNAIGGPWVSLGTVPGDERSLDATLPLAGARESIELAVQPVMRSGQRRRPESSARITHRLVGLQATRPSPPTRFRAEMIGDLARYDWAFAPGEEGSQLEVRRGGWVLGSPVFVSGPGATEAGPSRDWAGSSHVAPKLHVRTRNAIGAYSEALVVDFQPSPAVDPNPPGLQDLDRAWETHSGGAWQSALPAAGAPLVGAEFEQAGGAIQFTAASTTTAEAVAFTTAQNLALIPATPGFQTFRESRLVYVEAYLEAEYDYPGAAALAADTGLATRRWTTEGPLELLEGEQIGRVFIEMRLNEDGTSDGWGDWQLYRPGSYRVVEVQFRIQAQRPATDHNVRILKFHTRIRAPRQSMEMRTPVRAVLEGEAL